MYLEINPHKPETNLIKRSAEVIKNGGVIIYPTDTIYGIGCDIFNPKAVKKIYEIKKREGKKPMSIICRNMKEIGQYAYINSYAFRLMNRLLPGPYTFILKAKKNLPDTFISKKNRTIGVRIPDNEICLDLVKELENPIITTSANISGEPVFSDPSEIAKEISDKVDLIIDGGILDGDASTVVDLTGEEAVVLRKGKGSVEYFG